MRRLRHTKILATLGPASSDAATIESLYVAGADLFRFNFSHGTHEEHQHRFELVRDLEKRLQRPIGVIADLQGPKLRLGVFAEKSVLLRSGQEFRLDSDDALGDEQRVCLPHKEIIESMQPGSDLLLDDGKLRLKVVRAGANFLDTKVVIGGEISSNKGVNVLDTILNRPVLTDKDRKDCEFAIQLGCDFIALSFVQSPEDVESLRRLTKGRIHIMTKMEKPSAIERMQEIIAVSDAVMVARGDLGVELPPEEVPIQQKRLISACREAGKPVVVATHMLDSMVHAPQPTRAEASDVATAVYDGADAVTLSAETAAGKYCRESVAMMDRIICRVEEHALYRQILKNWHPPPQATVSDAVSIAAAQAAETLQAQVMVTFTKTGSTALLASRERPSLGILGLTADLHTARRLNIAWGVYPVVEAEVENFSDMVDKACRAVFREQMAQVGDVIVVTAGVPFGTAGSTNVVRIAHVEQHHADAVRKEPHHKGVADASDHRQLRSKNS